MTSRSRPGLPRRQRLVGLWLATSGLALFVGMLLALWLDTRLAPAGLPRWGLWLGCLSGGIALLLGGLLLERQLLGPLRRLQVLMARLAANPDARDDYPPEGWLSGLAPDIQQLRERWRADRRKLARAHSEGARSAARIRQELEALLQLIDVPLLVYDRHQRLLLFNHAAELLFAEHPGLRLGKPLQGLLENKSLDYALVRLPEDGTPRELLLPYRKQADLESSSASSPSLERPMAEHWLRCTLRRIPQSQSETLLTLEDATAESHQEMAIRGELVELVTQLRRHGAGLASAAQALNQPFAEGSSSKEISLSLRERLAKALDEEATALSRTIQQTGQTLERLQRQDSRLLSLWSNDLWRALGERLERHGIALTPIGMPAWLKADAPTLLVLMEDLVTKLAEHCRLTRFDAEVRLGNKRVYLDLIWPGAQPSQQQLQTWLDQPLEALPLAPSLAKMLQQYDSDLWSETDEDGEHARLRLPLPAGERVGAPLARKAPRPEFHDYGIASLPAPDSSLGSRHIGELEVIAFDTETTGLELRRGDRVISIGACRIVNRRLLADDVFESLVDPERPIPDASTAIHGLTDTDVAGAPTLTRIMPRFRDYLGDAVLLAHNASFDLLALQPPGSEVVLDMPVLDTLLISRGLDPGLEGHDLDSLAERFALVVPEGLRHTALGDAQLTAELWLTLLPRLEARGITTLADVLELQTNAFDKQDASA
ncbi:3'-5' exonuclease [Pistricoccus aurantiacus]|uniref:3'-5' exonuclease n=1 Tax=Pistricoccus aurantiacus TaxID=1883414 RepID=UPI00362D806D